MAKNGGGTLAFREPPVAPAGYGLAAAAGGGKS